MSDTGYYRELGHHSNRARAVGWENVERQEARYAWAAQHYRDGERVLDLGAGLGDFGRYLAQRHPHPRYLGIEQDPVLLARAAADPQPVPLLEGSYLDLAIEPAELVVALGCLVDGSSLKNDGLRFGKLRRLFERVAGLSTRKAVLLLLDQDALEKHPTRSLEPALGGIRMSEVPWLAPHAQVERVGEEEIGIILTPPNSLGL